MRGTDARDWAASWRWPKTWSMAMLDVSIVSMMTSAPPAT